MLTAVTGIANVSPNFTKTGAVLEHETLSVLGGESFAFLFVLSLFLPFDSLWTYLFGFSSDNRSLCHILSARILHEKTPDKKETSHVSISWQIPVMVSTFSTGFLYHLLSTFGKYDGSPCDDDRFLSSWLYLSMLEPHYEPRASRNALVWMDLSFWPNRSLPPWFLWLSWWLGSPPCTYR